MKEPTSAAISTPAPRRLETGPMKLAWISGAAPGTAVDRVGSALCEPFQTHPDFRKVSFNRTAGVMQEEQPGKSPVTLGKGFTRFGKTAFLLSFKGRLPAYDACFFDTQNLAFLAPPGACVMVYDLFYLTHPSFPLERLQGRILYQGLGACRAFMSDSEWTKQQMVQLLKIDPEKIAAIPMGYNREVFHPASVDGERFRAALGLSPRALIVLHVSSGEPRKNFDGLLRAFARLSKDVPEAILLKAGRDLKKGTRAEHEALVDALGLKSKVKFLGAVDDMHLAELYRAADCFVFPSKAEGFGLPVLEAQACGCPTVTSNVTALPEVAGPLSRMADPNDHQALSEAIKGVLADPMWRVRMAADNQAFLGRFTWEKGRRFLGKYLGLGE